MDETIIVGIIEDKLLGNIARLFIINKIKNKGFYPIEAQLSDLNYSRYAPQLDEKQKKIFQITQEYSHKNLYKLFGDKKDKTTKDFISHLDQEMVKKKIRPFIEKRMANLVDELTKTDIEVYLKDKHQYINKDHCIHIQKDIAKTIFHIEKQSQETRYSLSMNQAGEEIHLLNKSYRILSHDPCRMIIEDKLYTFEDIDANKLKPFFNKEFISVPKKFEKTWYENFALPNIKRFRINAKGFDIKRLSPAKETVITLTHDLSYQPSLLLSFYYDNERFPANKGQNTKVLLEDNNGHYNFFKIERDQKWETKKIKSLTHKGLRNYMISYFTLPNGDKQKISYQESLFALIDWLKKNKKDIEAEGFRVTQDLNNKKYNLSEFQFHSDIEEKIDWFDMTIEVKIGSYQFPFVSLKKYILNGIREIQLPNGEHGVLPKEWLSTYSDLFKFGKIVKNHLQIHKHHFKLLEKCLDITEKNHLGRLKKFMENFDQEEVKVPGELSPVLRPYQVSGYKWMCMLSRYELGGCLADDMGLGKTIQTLSMLLNLKKAEKKMEISCEKQASTHQLSLFERESKSGKVETTTRSASPTSLIVMPTSLIHNWQDEIQKFTPQIKFYKFTGMNRIREPEEFYNYDIILTSYGIVRNDYPLLKRIHFSCIILDESQYIKNPFSKIYQAVIELQAKNKFLLTGTPIENSLSDLWAQLNFLNKGLLGSYHFFKNEFIQPIEKHKNQIQESKLQALIDPFILRRTKYQVTPELPEKTEQVVYCEMSEAQKAYYESEKSKIRNKILENLENNEEQDTMQILDALSKLRQLANHPQMIDINYQDDSGKFREILDALHNLISENHKVLVFSAYKKHLALLEAYFRQVGWTYSLLTGETYNRQSVIHKFQNDAQNKIFLIQIKAGGYGLNLTAADYVLILDPWWNPAVEEQAVNRAHRIGQFKKVMVYRFITIDSVEEKIQNLQKKKSKLAKTFITPNEGLKKLSREQIMELFT